MTTRCCNFSFLFSLFTVWIWRFRRWAWGVTFWCYRSLAIFLSWNEVSIRVRFSRRAENLNSLGLSKIIFVIKANSHLLSLFPFFILWAVFEKDLFLKPSDDWDLQGLCSFCLTTTTSSFWKQTFRDSGLHFPILFKLCESLQYLENVDGLGVRNPKLAPQEKLYLGLSFQNTFSHVPFHILDWRKLFTWQENTPKTTFRPQSTKVRQVQDNADPEVTEDGFDRQVTSEVRHLTRHHLIP